MAGLLNLAAKATGKLASGAGKTAKGVGTVGAGAWLGSAMSGGGSGNLPPDNSKYASSAVMGNLGVVGQYGSNRFSENNSSASNYSSVAAVPIKRISMNDNQSTNRLLSVAINFLASLDANIKNQFNLQRAQLNQQARNDKENRLERQSLSSAKEAVMNGTNAAQESSGSGIASAITAALIPLLGLGVAGYAASKLGNGKEDGSGGGFLSGLGAGATGWGIGRNINSAMDTKKQGFFDDAGKKTKLSSSQLSALEDAGYKARGTGFANQAGKFVSDAEILKHLDRTQMKQIAKVIGKGMASASLFSVLIEASDYVLTGKKPTSSNLLESGMGILGGVIGGGILGFAGSFASPVGTVAGAVAGGIGGDHYGRKAARWMSGTGEFAGNTSGGPVKPLVQNNFTGRFSSPYTPGPTVIGSGGRVGEAMEFFTKRGYSKHQAAGIVGNLQQESTEKLDWKAKNDTGHRGIAQWSPERWAKYQFWLAGKGKKDNFQNQLEFLEFELNTTHKRAKAALQRSKSAGESAQAFEKHFERSGGSQMQKRISYANSLSSTPQISYATGGDGIVGIGKGLASSGYRVSENSAFGGVQSDHKGRAHYTGDAIDVNIGRGNVEANNPESKKKFDARALELQKQGYLVLWNGKVYVPDGRILPIKSGHKHRNHLHVEGKGGDTYAKYMKGAKARVKDGYSYSGDSVSPDTSTPTTDIPHTEGKYYFGDTTKDVGIKNRQYYSDSKAAAKNIKSTSIMPKGFYDKPAQPVIVVNDNKSKDSSKINSQMTSVPSPSADNSALSYQLYFGLKAA